MLGTGAHESPRHITPHAFACGLILIEGLDLQNILHHGGVLEQELNIQSFDKPSHICLWTFSSCSHLHIWHVQHFRIAIHLYNLSFCWAPVAVTQRLDPYACYSLCLFSPGCSCRHQRLLALGLAGFPERLAYARAKVWGAKSEAHRRRGFPRARSRLGVGHSRAEGLQVGSICLALRKAALLGRLRQAQNFQTRQHETCEYM